MKNGHPASRYLPLIAVAAEGIGGTKQDVHEGTQLVVHRVAYVEFTQTGFDGDSDPAARDGGCGNKGVKRLVPDATDITADTEVDRFAHTKGKVKQFKSHVRANGQNVVTREFLVVIPLKELCAPRVMLFVCGETRVEVTAPFQAELQVEPISDRDVSPAGEIESAVN